MLLTRLLLLAMCLGATMARAFDVRRHLGTKTRYAFRLALPGAPSIYKAPEPEGYEAVHLYLVARHGTRFPTADRMNQINSLDRLFRDAGNTADHPWLRNWTAPFPDTTFMGGELHAIGADELWGLAYRLRRRFPSLSGQDYLPKRFPVVSTQVARTAASASAFTAGFFANVHPRDPADDSPTVNPAPPAVEAAGGDAAGRARRAVLQGRSVPLLSTLDDLDETLQLAPTTRRPQDKIDPDALERLCGQDGKVVGGSGAAKLMYERTGQPYGSGPDVAAAS
ncbi:Multiple inositol polyphosphate phosphatase 1 [Tetrabaena socialis]|uniref:Multiple inositol polyphosphate phosphatase 1 n=1 Tax=Tetrabaena socialis TaxID=47790 RepID=A0A2J8A8N2_9CHLO|nr:Multiple inositol polyphosphate phosphatase 1 [Tetrabaena socialis]|eukprot:PNH08894.1 Multiple inositol polyphosphate phosphatase 1 [Tetrabaena socialis]